MALRGHAILDELGRLGCGMDETVAETNGREVGSYELNMKLYELQLVIRECLIGGETDHELIHDYASTT